VNRRRLVRVPASSANLGPGFDVLAVALALHVELEVVETGRFGVVTDLRIARDQRNLCVRGFRKLADPGHFEFRIRSGVPLSGGLGTSAAAYVAGLLAADSMFELDADVLAVGSELEGHPDNIAAALRGGFVVCAGGTVEKLPVPQGLEALLVVPHEAVRTKQARAALPKAVPMSDAAFNAGPASLLVLGLARDDFSLISRGLADRPHQPHRPPLLLEQRRQLRRPRYLRLERRPGKTPVGEGSELCDVGHATEDASARAVFPKSGLSGIAELPDSVFVPSTWWSSM